MKVRDKLTLKRIWLFGLLAALLVCLLLGMAVHFTIASDSADSLISINMTSINASLLTIGRTGISDSRLTIASEPIIIELTGLRVYPLNCSFGLLRPGDIRTTGQAFTIYNASNISVNATIAVASDWKGTTNWTHSDDCIPGVDTVGLMAIVDGNSGHTAIIVRKTEPYNYIVTNLAPGDSVTFALEIYAPTEFTDYSRKTNTIFITVDEVT